MKMLLNTLQDIDGSSMIFTSNRRVIDLRLIQG